MNNFLSKADQQKLNKLETAFDQLISGEENYFSITKLLSIKSLCKDEATRQKYCLYLYKHLTEHLLNQWEEQPIDDEIQALYILIKDVYRLRNEELSSPEAQQQLSTLFYQLGDYQNKTKRIKSTTVRMIKDSDLLTLELLTECLISTEEAAQKLAYYATRNYVERYNPSIGTGLITDSIPPLEDVLVFWRELSGEYEL